MGMGVSHLQKVLWQGLALLILCTSVTQQCPNRCQCIDDTRQVKVICIHLSLTNVPVGLPQNTTILNLRGNLISNLTLENSLLLPDSLTEIDFSQNKIDRIAETFFQNFTHLTTLSLDSNQISFIQLKTFQTLHSLRNLNLAKNELELLQANVFDKLSDLRVLNLSENSITDIENDTFQGLDSLHTLDLSYNKYLSLMNTSFLGTPNICKLYLRGCWIDESVQIVLSSVTSLTYLDLSYNSIPHINRSTFLDMPVLQHLVLYNCSITNIEPKSFSKLPSLVSLVLDHNLMEEVPAGTFDGLSNLEDLSMNYLPQLYYIYSTAFDSLRNLQVLSLSNNPRLGYIHSHTFSHLQMLTYLDLSFNNITSVHKYVYNKFKNITIDLTGNPLICHCELDWILQSIQGNSTSTMQFQNQQQLNCRFEDSLPLEYPLGKLSVDDLNCKNVSIHPTSYNNSVIFFPIGKSATLSCVAEGYPSPLVTWITPRNRKIYYHNTHPLIHKEHFSNTEMGKTQPFHTHHWWHESSYYHSEIEDHPDRIVILRDGSLYIDYILRSDAGPYTCVVQNSRNKFSMQVNLRLNYEILMEIKIMSLFVGLGCAASFFMLNLIYAFVSALARRCINQRRREAILKLLENLEQYKSTQMSRLRDNYSIQSQRIRDTYHQRLDRLSNNYNAQMMRIRQGASHLREGASHKVGTIRGNYKSVRENYNTQLGRLREYSSHQLEQLREMYSNQVLKIRDYGSLQLGRFHHKYKLQQQHVMKLLEMMNMDNCRTVFDTECVHAESIILSEPNLETDPATMSPTDTMSVSDEEYVTASSESSSHSSRENLNCDQDSQSGEIHSSSVENTELTPLSKSSNPEEINLLTSKYISDSEEQTASSSESYRDNKGDNVAYADSDTSCVTIQMIDESDDNVYYGDDDDNEESNETMV